MSDCSKIIEDLRKRQRPKDAEGMKRFGIFGNVLGGTNMPTLRKMAKGIGKNHSLAQELWDSGIFEARLLAVFIDDWKQVTKKQLNKWVNSFDNWAICDGACLHLLDRTPWAYASIFTWVKSKKEFVKRTGFSMMAVLAVHDKQRIDADFLKFFPLIKQASNDERNFVKKAVNWALRQIGKRNPVLRKKAMKLAEDIYKLDTKPARWIASDAIRELSKVK